MNTVYLDGIGIDAPGLNTWKMAEPILRGEQPYHFKKTPRPIANLIPANERRRASDTIHLAAHVAEEAVNHAHAEPSSLINVFASFKGDLKIIDHLCHALTLPDRPVSPTQFHNSVFNSPAAYWSIATDSRGPSTSVACAQSSFPAALLSAVSSATTENRGVLLVTYDVESPKPFHEQYPIEFNCGIALVLSPTKTQNSLAMLTIHFRSQRQGSGDIDLNDTLKHLLSGNASAQALSLLSAVARNVSRNILFDYLTYNAVEVDLQPCR